MKTPILIVGTGHYADVFFQLVNNDARYIIKAFAEESAIVMGKELNGLPVHSLDNMPFTKNEISLFIAVEPHQTNNERERLYLKMKEKGFECIRYIHPSAIIWDQNAIGENSSIFPGCIIESYAKVGNNCALWSGTIIGHHTVIQDHCFIASGCAIAGNVVVHKNSFLGINATVRDNLQVPEKSIIGGGTIVKNNSSVTTGY